MAYNRDLQEDKEPLFDSVDQVTLVLRALAGMYATVRWNDAAMRSAADAPGAAAVDVAEFLVRSGVPFRRAHAIVGGLVAASIADGVPLVDLVAAHPQLGEDAASLLTPGTPVTMKTTPGGAGPEAVAQQIRALVTVLDGDRQRLAKISP